MEKTPRLANLSADNHLTDKLLIVMKDFVIEIQYLRRAFGTKTYLIDKVTGSLFALHNDHIKSMGFCGSKCVFDLQELEFHMCELADRRNGEEDTRSVARGEAGHTWITSPDT